MPFRSITPAIIAAVGSLALAGPAAADSISFLRGGDIWVAAPDGSHQTQLTHDGGYSYQSRADDGSFIALAGRRLRRLSAAGTVLADFDTPVSGAQTAPNGSYFTGPFKPEISPDGSKVAYEYRWEDVTNRPGCYPTGSKWCVDSVVHGGIGYTHADRSTAWDEPGLGYQSGWLDPSWIGNDAVLVSDKTVVPNLDAMVDRPGDGEQTIQGWFADDSLWSVRDGVVSRRGDAAAFVSTKQKDSSDPDVGARDDQLTVYRLHGAAPALPEQCFSYAHPAHGFNSPSFAPDGHAIAVEDSGTQASRILVGAVPDQSGGCQSPVNGLAAVIDDGRDPAWSPAPVPAVSTPGPRPGRGPKPAPKPVVKPHTRAVLRVSVVRTTRARALTRGLTLRIAASRAGTAHVRVLLGKRTLATGTATVRKGRTTTLRLRLTRAGRARLAARRPARLTVRIALTGGRATTTTTTLR